MSLQPVSKSKTVRQIASEILSQLLNVPILSGMLVTFLFFKLPSGVPNRLTGFGWALLFMCLLPLGSLFFYIPGRLKDWPAIIRRQRIASFVFMIVCYPLGFLALRLAHAPKIFEAIAVTYTCVTLGLIVLNLFFRYKASGHAAGVAGPVAAMVYLYGLVAAPLVALLPLVTWARVNAKGHNFWQMVVGTVLSFTIALTVLWAYGFNPFLGRIY